MKAFLVLAAMAAGLMAASTPVVGQKAPDFELTSIEGKPVRLSELTAMGPVVLIVLRGYPGYQCPFCNRQAQDFLQKSAQFAERGARVVMVYPGPRQDLAAKAAEFASNKTIPGTFELVLDPDYALTELYGLRWDAPKETAYPSTFVINGRGEVYFLKVVKSHGGRTSAQEVIDVLPKPKAGSATP